MRRQPGDIFTGHENPPGRWLKNPGYHIEKCGFSGTIWAYQAGDRALFDLKRRSVNSVKSTKMFMDVLNNDHILSAPNPLPLQAILSKETARKNRAVSLFQIVRF